MFANDPAIWPQGHAPANDLCGEDERLSVVAAHGLDTLEDDPELARIVGFAAQLCGAPIALVSIVEEQRQRFLARTGLDIGETPRPTSFCAHAMLDPEPMVVCDARADSRFAANPLVTGAPHIRFYAGAPLVSHDGAPLGALCVIDTVPRPMGLTPLQREGLEVLADAVKRRLLQQRRELIAKSAIETRELRLRRVLDSVPGIAWSADSRANFDYFSARWREVTGRETPKVAADWKPFVHPDDFARTWEDFSKALGENVPYEGEFRLLQADNSWRWVLSRAVPVIEVDARGARWVGTLVDIDEAHRLSENRELLANELSHRIKNIFAVIAGLISIRSRGREEVRDFAQELDAAIKSLSLAHDYVRPVEGRKSDRLLGLLRDLLAPYDRSGGSRVQVAGDDIAIGPQAATPLALVFHELATNAAKYGALACEEGRIAIEVTTPCHDEDTVCVSWRESGCAGAPPGDSSHEGFGSRLLRMSVEGQLGGRFERRFGPEGLDIELRVPRKRITG